MLLNGTITNIEPKGGYQSANGYIYTFDMAIETPQGSYLGEIGSKTEQYALNVGDPIMVEATQSQHGMRFKKVNPKFAPQQRQSVPQAPAQPQQAQRPAPAPKNGNGQDEVYRYRSMCLAYVKDLIVAGAITPADINAWLDRCMKYILSGLWLNTDGAGPQQSVGAGVENDDIPF